MGCLAQMWMRQETCPKIRSIDEAPNARRFYGTKSRELHIDCRLARFGLSFTEAPFDILETARVAPTDAAKRQASFDR